MFHRVFGGAIRADWVDRMFFRAGQLYRLAIGRAAGTRALGPGLHVVTERSPNGSCPRGDLVRARWPVDPALPKLRDLLTVHAPPPERATCIHMDPAYGTRSSAVLRLAPDLRASELFVAEARPCVAPLEDRSHLLAALARSA